MKHFLEQCLISVIHATEGITSEIWVVDNNSVDGSVQMIQEKFEQVNLISNTENFGFSKANNQAIRQCNSEYVLLLNPDTVVPKDCFHSLLDFMDKTPDAGAAGVRMIDGQGRFLPESKRGLPTPEVALYKMLGLNRIFSKSKKFGKYHLGFLPELEVNEVEVLAGAFMLIRKTILDKVGLLDETFFMYGEDIDLSYRITQAGFKNYYYPSTTIIHYKGESTKKQSVNYVKVFYKAMIIFAEKHYTGSHKTAFKTFINSAIYLRAALTLITNFISKYWLLMLEMVLIFFSLLFLKDYWEEHIKYIKSYPPEMLYIHLPYYTASWILSLLLLGSYKQVFNFGRLLRATALGTIIILVVYGLLPEHLHFSRGIILFGFLVISAVLILFRSLVHLVQFKSLDFRTSLTTRSIVVGNQERWAKLKSILEANNHSYQQIGFVNNLQSNHEQHLGSINQLAEVVQIFNINEIIFSADAIDASETMQWMNSIGPQVNYYIVPEGSDFVIGSHSKNATGVYMGQQIELFLSKPEYRKRKRLFDIISSFILLITFPISALLFTRKGFFKDLIQVLSAKKTWISYSSKSNQHLPDLKKGIFYTNEDVKESNELQNQQLDRLYAKNYSMNLDLNLLWKGLRK